MWTRRTLGLLGLAAMVAIGSLVAVQVSTIDGMPGVIGGLLGEDTVYAVGYTDSAWRRVSIGMTRSDVVRLLGTPQKEWRIKPSRNGAENGARWSYSPGDTNYRCRVLLFRHGVVVEKHSEFYFD